MYKLISPGRRSKIYDQDTHRIKCNLCDNYMQLGKGDYQGRHTYYICPECEKRLKRRYQYTHKSMNYLARTDKGKKLLDWLWSFHDYIDENFIYEMNQELSNPCPVCGQLHLPREQRNKKYHICNDCYKKLPGYDETKKINKLIVCDIHGFTIVHNPAKTSCDICEQELRKCVCKRCGKTYIDNRSIGHIKRDGDYLCEDCKDDLKVKLPQIAKYCENCGKWVVVDHNFNNCPNCNSSLAKYKINCVNCGKDSIVDNPAKRLCNDCVEECSKSEAAKKYEEMKKHPMVQIKGNILMKPIQYGVYEKSQMNVALICPNCGRPFYGHGGKSKFCGDCFIIKECECCGREFLTHPNRQYNICSRRCSRKQVSQKLWDEQQICNAISNFDISSINIHNFSDIIYHDQKIEISNDNIFNYRKIGAVWYLKYNDEILNVHQTTNLTSEFLKVKKIIDEILSGEKVSLYTASSKYMQMYKDGIKFEEVKFYILELEENIQRRFDVEAKFAMDSKCKYWNPAPGYQISLLRKKENKNE